MQQLTATCKFQNAADQTCMVKFEVQAWRSREHIAPNDNEEQDTVLVVRTRRLEVMYYRLLFFHFFCLFFFELRFCVLN